jgi:hypothetical protein
MSGALGFAGSVFPQPIQLTKSPPLAEGPKSVAVAINWQSVFNGSGAFVQNINLLQQFQSGQFSTVQSVYIDNQTCPEMVTLVCSDTGQQIRIPPFSKGMYPIFCSQSPEFTVTLNLSFDPITGNAFSQCSTRLFFLNVRQEYFEAEPVNFGQNFNHFEQVSLLSSGATTIALTGLTGAGVNQSYAITSIDVSIAVLVAYAAAQAVVIQLQEVEVATYNLWSSQFYVTTASLGVVFSRQSVFPTPILQFQSNGALQFKVQASPSAVNGMQVVLSMTYAIVTIE